MEHLVSSDDIKTDADVTHLERLFNETGIPKFGIDIRTTKVMQLSETVEVAKGQPNLLTGNYLKDIPGRTNGEKGEWIVFNCKETKQLDFQRRQFTDIDDYKVTIVKTHPHKIFYGQSQNGKNTEYNNGRFPNEPVIDFMHIFKKKTGGRPFERPLEVKTHVFYTEKYKEKDPMLSKPQFDTLFTWNEKLKGKNQGSVLVITVNFVINHKGIQKIILNFMEPNDSWTRNEVLNYPTREDLYSEALQNMLKYNIERRDKKRKLVEAEVRDERIVRAAIQQSKNRQNRADNDDFHATMAIAQGTPLQERPTLDFFNTLGNRPR